MLLAILYACGTLGFYLLLAWSVLGILAGWVVIFDAALSYANSARSRLRSARATSENR